MLKIGLTGGIGSGKTTVARIFEILRIPVYYADERARQLMNTNPVLKEQIIRLFGPEAYAGDELNRPFIASVAFSDKSKLQALNEYVHPVTISDGENWMNEQKTPYALKEAALIFESKVNQYLDFVIGVSAPRNLRIERVAARDAASAEQVQKRMNNQMEEEEKLSLCDFIIYNDETKPVIPQVIQLHEKILLIAAEKHK